jgi:primosomal protein N' (replication factor Y)
MHYYDLAVAGVHTDNKYYTYASNFTLPKGAAVIAPFKSLLVSAIVINKVKKPTFKTKVIKDSIGIVLPYQNLQLLKWMHDFYADDQGSINSLFLTKKINLKSIHKPPLNSFGRPLPEPTAEQAQAILCNDSRIVLHGETGSGKTRVFIEKAEETAQKGSSVLILTPEIGLTPQLYTDFINHVSVPVIVNHSGLSDNERSAIWRYCQSNKPSIYIGPRSTLFLPYGKLGLIVLDEAHDNSYKQNQSPRYNALTVATKLAQLHNADLIYSTATPNTDDFYKFSLKKYKVIRLKKTIGDKPHQLTIIDQSKKELFNQSSVLSDALIALINRALKNNLQSLILLNRRGTARLVECIKCGYIFDCKNCGIPLIFHQDLNKLVCHTCNAKKGNPKQCPSCASVDISYNIPGTKSLYSHIQKTFPNANIARFDKDTLKKDSITSNYHNLKTGRIDIIVGTQIISKGLDLPNLAVVGVINADNGIYLPDYRSEEVSFQQLYQVTGRATRGFISTHSIIQTRTPKHPIMQSLKRRDWNDFYKYELKKRQHYQYPPFSYLALIKTKSKTANNAYNASVKLAKQIVASNIRVLGPSPAFIEKQNGFYVYQLVLKTKKRSDLVEVIKNLDGKFSFDIDPVSLL